MCKVSVLWYIGFGPNDDFGWVDYSFDDERAAFAWLKDNIEGIDFAEWWPSGGLAVADGKLLCAACGAKLLCTDRVLYPICEDCDG